MGGQRPLEVALIRVFAGGGVGADECEEDTCVSYEEEDTRMHAYRRRWVGADECEAVKAIDGWARNALIPDESFFQVTKR